jgi:hypothetical protein
MNSEMKQDPKPYIEMKDRGATPEEVFRKALSDGHKNFECIALLCGVFDIPLHKAREIAHQIHREGLGKS